MKVLNKSRPCLRHPDVRKLPEGSRGLSTIETPTLGNIEAHGGHFPCTEDCIVKAKNGMLHAGHNLANHSIRGLVLFVKQHLKECTSSEALRVPLKLKLLLKRL